VAALDEAVDMIRDAGGVAVVAHPGRYKLNELALHTLLGEFRELGGTGIEVATSNHSERDMRRFADLAREFGFEASGGSDFHGPGESDNVELGRGRAAAGGSDARVASFRLMAQLFSVHPSTAGALAAAGGADPGPRRGWRDSHRFLLRARLPSRRQGGGRPGAADPRIDERHLLTLMCRDLSDIGLYAKVDNRQYRLLKNATPGPYTFILEATREVPRRLSHPSRKTIGLRVPDHRVAAGLLDVLGQPLLTTTLQLPGDEMPLNDPMDIVERLDHQIDFVLDAGACGIEPTTIVDLTGRKPCWFGREGRGGGARPVVPLFSLTAATTRRAGLTRRADRLDSMEEIIQQIAVYAIPVLFAITVHEAAHGYVARMFGDNTAYVWPGHAQPGQAHRPARDHRDSAGDGAADGLSCSAGQAGPR